MGEESGWELLLPGGEKSIAAVPAIEGCRIMATAVAAPAVPKPETAEDLERQVRPRVLIQG